MLSSDYKYNVFLVIRNEESHIRSVIDAVKAQAPPPSRILVSNDGSTDNTEEILDSIDGIEVTHYEAHPHDLISSRYFEIRNNLFKLASKGVDYILCLDGDTVVPNSYVQNIVERMRCDGVVIACGQDLQNKITLVVESPSIIDVRWLEEFPHPTRTISMNASHLVPHASLTGFRSAVYTDICIDYKRKIGTNYNPRHMELFGESFKKDGFSLWYVIIVAIKRRRLSYIRGYVASKAKCEDRQLTSWTRRYQTEKVFGRFGMRHTLLRTTSTAIYVEPVVF